MWRYNSEQYVVHLSLLLGDCSIKAFCNFTLSCLSPSNSVAVVSAVISFKPQKV